jgi:nucleotide-binding universal stress UspA family protein
LIVAQGWFGRRRVEIPIETIREVDHDRRRLVLRRGAVPPEPNGPLQRLLGLGRGAEEAVGAWPRTGDEARPVLCGVDDDARGTSVVAVAARLAQALGAPLVVAHVTPAHVPPAVSAVPGGHARLRREEQDDAEELLDRLLSRRFASTDVKRLVARGTPAEALEKLAGTQGAQLLVIGATGKGSFGVLLKGSVSRHLINHARCPVVVVPPEVTHPNDQDRDGTNESPGLVGVGSDRASGSVLTRGPAHAG